MPICGFLMLSEMFFAKEDFPGGIYFSFSFWVGNFQWGGNFRFWKMGGNFRFWKMGGNFLYGWEWHFWVGLQTPLQTMQENPRIFPMMIWDTKPDLNEKYIVIEYVLILILWYGSIVEGYRHGFCAIKYIYMWNLNYWHVSLLYIGSTFYSIVHECFLSKSDQNWVFLRVTARLQVCPKQDTPFYGSHMKESQESEAL